jgi:hypothetical protein
LGHVIVGAALFISAPVFLTGCSKGPSKAEAFEAIQSGVKEDGSCTLPVDILSRVKMQHSTKGICVPKEGAEKAKTCIDALVAAGVTKRMPDAYMLAWPDEVATASLADIPAYERRARNLVYSECVELAGALRDGRFGCAAVQAEKVLRVTALDDTHADVEYERKLTLKPSLTAIDAACGTVTRPPGESTVAFSKTEGTWGLASLAPAGDGGVGGAN